MKKGTEEIFAESGNFDTRKVLNRSRKLITAETMNEIETNGVTSEQLDALKIPVFKYKTQITLHGHFPEISKDRLNGYKALILNGNESLGVKYTAVDLEKKQRIYSYLGHVGYSIERNSTQHYAFWLKIFGNREEALAQVKEFKALKEKIDTSLFFGKVYVSGGASMLGYIVQLVVNIGAIYEKNVDRCIENITQFSIKELDEQRAAKKAQREKENAEWEKELAAKRKVAEKERNEKLSVIVPAIEALKGKLMEATEPVVGNAYIRITERFDMLVRIPYRTSSGSIWTRYIAMPDLAAALAYINGGDYSRAKKTEAKKLIWKNTYEIPISYKGKKSSQPAQHVAVQNVTIRKNEEKNGVEIIFPAKPEQSVIDTLKANGFRWSKFQGLWWNRYTESTWSVAQSLTN